MSIVVRVAALVLVLATVGVARAQEVTLSVAISMKEAVEELGKGFMAVRPGVTLRYNFGSSGELEKKTLIAGASRRVFARNVLVVIKPADSKIDITKPADLLDLRVTKIVVGNPKTVPAGQYSEESLKALGLWDRLRPKLVFSENVRQALDYVARGEVDAGFVYTTDAATRLSHVKEAFRPAEDTYRPVVYPAAVVAGAKQAALAQAFLDLLASRDGQATLARFGFQPPPAGTR